MKPGIWRLSAVAMALCGAIALPGVRSAIAQTGIEPALLAEIGKIKAIDNHAHPLRVTGPGQQRDNDEDALDQLPMPPFTLTPRVRSDNPELPAAWRALFGYEYSDASAAHRRRLLAARQRLVEARGDSYPAFILDLVGIDTMLANRVAMGRGLAPPRFRWVAFDDALIFPLSNEAARRENPDYQAFFASEEVVRARYLSESGLRALPPVFDNYLARVVTGTLERQKNQGALAVKFEAAYLRSLDFADAPKSDAAKIYQAYVGAGEPSPAEYKMLQDFLFRYIAREAGRLGMAVHVHVAAGVGDYFKIQGTNPLLLESVFNDRSLRKTNFVMVHGGWPFTAEAGALLIKPNVYADFSFQTYLTYPRDLARVLRSWLEFAPEKVLFGTDAFDFSPEVGWETSAMLATATARQALALALSAMMSDGEITRPQAIKLARMVMRENAIRLYSLRPH